MHELMDAAEAAGGARPDTRNRSEIPERYTWDLSHIYPSWEAWAAELERLRELMAFFRDLRGTLVEGPDRLLAAVRLSDEIGKLTYLVYRYPALHHSEDTRDNTVQARVAEVRVAMARFRQDTAWYTPELLSIPLETVRSWIDTTPELEPYRFPLEETFRQAEHVLDENGERILAYATTFNGTPSNAYSMMADADVEFPEVRLSDGRTVTASHAAYMNGIRALREQRDREALFKAHFSVYDRFPNTYASIYDAVLQRDWFTAQARRYETTLDAALDEDAVPASVVENLIGTARDGAGVLQRYQALRRRFLGLERYRYFDAYVPLVDVDWPFPYDRVKPVLTRSVAPFGADYQRTVEHAFDERWIDVYESEGKRSGAFSAGVYGVHPYMLLNYADTVEDAFTVAHEMGHTMHTVLSHRAQPFATAEYTIFVAEVASMTSEDLFLDELLRIEDDPRRRVVLLQHAVDDIASGFYRQAMFADYELRAHREVEGGQPITAEVLRRIYLEVLAGFFGDSLDDQEWYRNQWAAVPHFFAVPYYVYQYATSKAAANLLHERMISDDAGEREETVRRYLELLSSGGSDHPMSQLRTAGVDFATAEPMQALVATMDRLVGELESELERVAAG